MAQLGSGALLLGPNEVAFDDSNDSRKARMSSGSSSLVRSITGFSGREAVACFASRFICPARAKESERTSTYAGECAALG